MKWTEKKCIKGRPIKNVINTTEIYEAFALTPHIVWDLNFWDARGFFYVLIFGGYKGVCKSIYTSYVFSHIIVVRKMGKCIIIILMRNFFLPPFNNTHRSIGNENSGKSIMRAYASFFLISSKAIMYTTN